MQGNRNVEQLRLDCGTEADNRTGAVIKRLEDLGRRDWLNEEMLAWQDNLEESVSRQRWMRVSGISGLSPRGMAIIRELWQWREDEAQRRNTPARRVLRDDLIVEMAKRQTADPKRITCPMSPGYTAGHRWTKP